MKVAICELLNIMKGSNLPIAGYIGLNLLKAGYNEGGDLRAVEYNEGFEFAYRRRALPQPVDQLLPKAAKPIIGPKLLFIRSPSMNSNVFKSFMYLS